MSALCKPETFMSFAPCYSDFLQHHPTGMDGHFKNEGDDKFANVQKDNDTRNIVFDVKDTSFSFTTVFMVIHKIKAGRYISGCASVCTTESKNCAS